MSIKRSGVLLLLVLWVPGLLAAQSREEASDSLVQSYMREHGVPGVGVAISLYGDIIYAATMGYADLEMNVPVTSGTLFPTASVLKPMTATAVTALALSGALDLDEPIQTYCPAYPEKRWPVTPRALIPHAGGVRSSVFADIFNREHYASVEAALVRFAADSLLARPGTAVAYSNAGYTLLACAIEGAAGVTYDDYLREHIFERADMTNTRRDNVFEVIPGRARAYMVRTAANTEQWKGLWQDSHLSSTRIDEPFNADPTDPSWSPGAGGYLTTPVDLVRFAAALMDGRLLPTEYVSRIPQPYRLTSGEPVQRTHGWVLDEFEGRTVLQVLGSNWNGSSGLWVVPDEGFAIAVSTNKGFEQPGQLVEALAQVWTRSISR
jgi:CubicO group peptidase (beta-lactamase class C family)